MSRLIDWGCVRCGRSCYERHLSKAGWNCDCLGHKDQVPTGGVDRFRQNDLVGHNNETGVRIRRVDVWTIKRILKATVAEALPQFEPAIEDERAQRRGFARGCGQIIARCARLSADLDRLSSLAKRLNGACMLPPPVHLSDPLWVRRIEPEAHAFSL